MSTKIHATVDALGNLLSFHLMSGQASDLDGADKLLPDVVADTVLAVAKLFPAEIIKLMMQTNE